MKQSNKQNFLFQKQEEKRQRELQRKQQEMASKIWLFYKNGKICQQIVENMIQNFTPKINGVFKIKEIKVHLTFIKACNLSLIKCPEFLKPLLLLNEKNIYRYSNYLLNLLMLFNGCLECKTNNFIIQIFQNTQQLSYRLLFLKSLTLGLHQSSNSINQDSTQILINIDKIILQIQDKFQLDELNYFYSYFTKCHPNIFQKLLLNLINLKGIYQLIINYIKTNQLDKNVQNLAFDLFIITNYQDNDYTLIFNIILQSSKLKQLFNDQLNDQQIEEIWILFYKIIQSQVIDSSAQLELLLYLMKNLEINFFQNFMFSDYKNVIRQNNNEYKKYKILRKKKEYKQFLDKINEPFILEFLKHLKYVNGNSLGNFLHYLLSISDKTKLLLKLFKNQFIEQHLREHMIKSAMIEQEYNNQASPEFISLYCFFKSLEFQFQDDQEFNKKYLSTQADKQQFNLIFKFLIQQIKNNIINQENKFIQKELVSVIREIFERNQTLNFYTWQYENDQQLINNTIICNKLPFLIPFPHRINIFNDYLENDKKQFSRSIHDLFMINIEGEAVVKQSRLIIIKRGYELQYAYDQLVEKQLKHLYHVKFINQMDMVEDGIDGGGVTKEFITRVINQALDPLFGLFIETTERTIIPNPILRKENLDKYQFIGKIIGKAIYEGILIEKVLCQIFLNQVLGISNTINDFKYYDKTQYHNLFQLKNQDVTNFGLTFSVIEDEYGTLKEINLTHNGNQIEVTNDNKEFYIKAYSNFKLNEQIKIQSQKFKEGLEELIDPEKLKSFTNQELQLLISGQPVIDIYDLIQHTTYQGYKPSDQTILLLWEVLNELPYEQQSLFLLFFSSCSRAPTQGFKSLDPPFQIQKVAIFNQNDLQKLPTASTCFNILKLPDYKDKQLLQQKLIQAINSNTGFELT